MHYKKYLKSSINNIVHKEQNKERRNSNKTMQELNIKYMNIRDLKPYKKNAKKHNKEQVEQIANSIKEFGFTQPVIIDKNNEVVAGHGRILGAKKAGLKKVPTVCLEDLTEDGEIEVEVKDDTIKYFSDEQIIKQALDDFTPFKSLEQLFQV